MVDIATDSDKVFKWGDITTSPKDVPLQSLFALAQRGFTHVLGNEVAAQVSAYKKTEEGAGKSEADLEAYASEKRQEKLAKILDGTLGVRTAAGPRVTGVEALKRSIAVEMLKATLKKHNVALPTGENTITMNGKVMTREQLVESAMRSWATKIDAEAERRQAAQADVGEDLFA